MQPNKLSLVALVAGVVMFLLPWIEVQCQGRSFIRQSGAQAVAGTASVAEEFTKGAKMKMDESPKSLGVAGLVIAAGVLALLALRAAWRNVQAGIHEPEQPGRFAAIAVALIALQMWLGFPLENKLRDEMKKGMSAESVKDPLGAALQQQLTGIFQTKYIPGLYLCLAALAVPVLQWLTAPSQKRDGEEGSDHSS